MSECIRRDFTRFYKPDSYLVRSDTLPAASFMTYLMMYVLPWYAASIIGVRPSSSLRSQSSSLGSMGASSRASASGSSPSSLLLTS
jgi:hypothetical protein